jgi:4-hydroxythreonine-4-phosphate dehydrogenase
MPHRPLIAVTMGDPSGVGPEVVAKALLRPAVQGRARTVVIGSPAVMEATLGQLGAGASVAPLSSPVADVAKPGEIAVFDPVDARGPFPVGAVSVASARAAHAWVECAARLCLDETVAAMVTAPINKEAFHLAGITDTGHQEVLKRLSGAGHVATMLVSGKLRCMHLSTHKPLKEACAYVTRSNVLAAIRLTDEHFKAWGVARPRIAVAALNPHASDNGLIGHEEIDEIAPAVQDAVSEGVDATGPVPADSVFNHAVAGRYDVVVVMYHDQGHIAIKVHGFEESVSVNLGLPFIRTSVDHGTAFDIAGKGVADETSMVEAINLAVALATKSGVAFS